jgi:mannose-6-phosphate isomerase-like protein (cupin superfamily)
MIDPYVGKLKSYARHNTSFRHVLFTARQMQLVVMSLQPGEEIGTEVHEVDQLIYFVEGEGKVVLDGEGVTVEKGTVVCVPAGVQHNVIAGKSEAVKLFTVYAPPVHVPGTIHKTKADAEAGELAGSTSEIAGR